MFARVLTLYVRLEKKLELANRIIQDVIPLLQRTVGPLDVFVLQDEKDVDRMVVMSLWRSKEDADRHHVSSYEKVTSILQPYLTMPPLLRTYRVDDASPLNLLAQHPHAAADSEERMPQLNHSHTAGTHL
jgi:heme-degrading monooxygenase HmoA